MNSNGFMMTFGQRYNDSIDYITNNSIFQVVIIAIVLIYDIFILAQLIYNASQFESPEKAKKSNSMSKILSVVFQVKSKVIYTIEVLLLAHIFQSKGTSSNTVKILLFAGSILCLALSFFIEFVLNLILNIRVRLIDEIPWCSQKSIFPAILSFFKLANGVCLAVHIP